MIHADTDHVGHDLDRTIADQPATSVPNPRPQDLRHYPSAQHVERFWRSFMRFGFCVLAVESIAVLLYLLLTPSGPHRGVIEAIVALTIGVALAGIVAAKSVAKVRWHSNYDLAVTLVVGAIITMCCALDGGIDSPLVYFVVMPVISAAFALRATHVVICAAAAILEISALAIFDSDITNQGWLLFLLFSFVIGVCSLGVLFAAARARLQAEDALIRSELARIAQTDPLTGCFNHGAFNNRLSHEIDRFDRYGSICSLLVADIDLFKSYNDAHGHLAGDDMLASIGRGLMAAARRSDMVARIGGDEFAVILPSTSREVAEQVAERLEFALRTHDHIDVTLSIGVGVLDPTEPTERRLFRDADAALYLAKASGRARVACLNEGSTLQNRQNADSHQAMKSAEDQDLFEDRMRQVQQQTAETSTVIDAILEAAPVGLCFMDRDYRILRINDVLAQFLVGDVALAPKGHKVPDVVSPALWQQIEPVIKVVFEEDAPVATDVIVTESGTHPRKFQYWRSTFFPVHFGAEVTGLGVVAMDITDQCERQDAERSLIRSMVGALSAAVEAQDPYISGHQQSVALIGSAIAAELGLDPKTIDEIELAARIHDLGKVRVPAEILARPGRLNDAELALVHEHPSVGDEILASVDFPPAIREMVLQHHERMDGTGYPQGLVGAEICLGARVIAVADVVDSMASSRPYRRALGRDAALAEIVGKKGYLYDEQVVDACVRVFRKESLSGIGYESARPLSVVG